MSDRAIRSVLVAGDGLVGLSAALAFSRALPHARVTILSLPLSPPDLADLLPSTLPIIGRFHAAIGLNEIDLVRDGIAHHHLGTRFTGFGPRPWIHSFGEVGRGEGAVPFHQLWLRAFFEGRALAFDRYSAASVIGEAGKFVHPSGDLASPLSTYLYALRLNPRMYRSRLEKAASHIPRITSTEFQVERRESGGIAALLLSGDRREKADLFLDCTGPRALLLSQIDEAYDDWSRWIPSSQVSRMWSNDAVADPLDHASSDGSTLRLIATSPGASLTASFELGSGILTGRRGAPFVHNVLALGDAAVALGPLHSTGLSLAHSAIMRAIDLLPGRNFHPLELAEYNRLTGLETERARDFVALHFLSDTSELPPTLRRTLEQWRARGRLPFFEEETFNASSWSQALIGMGIMPTSSSPQTSQVESDASSTAMAELASTISALVARIPAYADYLAQVSASASR